MNHWPALDRLTAASLSAGRVRRAAVLLWATCALVLALGVSSASASLTNTCVGADANAATLVSPSCFEALDGNVKVDSSPALHTDWVSLAPTVAVPDALAPTDTEFAGGAAGKEQDPGAWGLITGITTPGKSDILAAAARSDSVLDGSGNPHLMVYTAFERQDGSGNANVSFELNHGCQSTDSTAGSYAATCTDGKNFDNDGSAATPKVPFRTEGDVLITYDGNNSNGVTVGMCKWHGDAYGETSSSAYGWYTLPGFGLGGSKLQGSDNCTTLSTSGTPAAGGGMNNGNLINTTTGVVGGPRAISNMSETIGDNLFGEMAIDLGRALSTVGDPTPCFDFGSIWMHSRSSDTPTSNMIDYVAPNAIPGVSSCKVHVDKTVSTDGTNFAAGTGHDTDTDHGPDSTVYAHGDGTLTYHLTVTNPGTAPLSADTSYTDPITHVTTTMTQPGVLDSQCDVS